MRWKAIKKYTPQIGVMGTSGDKLLLWDGNGYHRGYAKMIFPSVDTCNLTSPSTYTITIKYFSYETNKEIFPIKFLEIEPAEKRIMTNVWYYASTGNIKKSK